MSEILHLEDSEFDAALVKRTLESANVAARIVRTADVDEFRSYLRRNTPDLIISDYTLPRADGIAALKIARELLPDVPFIFVSGTIGEDRAAEALKLGATDYVLKDRMDRLVPSITRALREKRAQRLRQEAQDALEQSHELLRAVIDGTGAAIFAQDGEGRYVFANAAAARLLGKEVADVLGKTDEDLLLPTEMPKVSSSEEEDVVAEQLVTVQQTAGAESLSRTYAVTREPLRGRDGQIRGVIGIGRNVTDWLRLQAALSESERRYRSLFNDAPVGLYRSTPDGTWLDVNPAMLTLLGYSDIEKASQRKATEHYVDRHDRRRWQEAMARDGAVLGFEFQMRRLDGATLWVRENARVVKDADGRPLFYEGALHDFTRRHAAELRVATQYNLTRVLAKARDMELVAPAVLESIAEVEGWLAGELWTADRHVRRLRCRGTWSARGDALPSAPSYATFGLGEGLPGQAWRSGQPVHVDAGAARAAGAPHMPSGVRSARAFPIFGGAEVAGVLVFYASDDHGLDPADAEMIDGLGRQIGDFVERQAIEEQFRQAQKMEAIGQLAGGVAHDFNNLITAINGYAQLLLDDLPPNDVRREDLEEICRAGERGAGLTKQLLAFSRHQILQPRVLILNEVVAGMNSLLRRIIGEDVELVTALSPSLASIRADPGQIEQVIVNLAVNARDAMPDGGRLTIETSMVEVSGSDTPDWPNTAQRCVCLAVTDDGEGMDEDTRSRIFEPFFTTKPQGKGTGLGLATVFGIVKQNGGHIEVQSAPGVGTTFRISFPAVATQAGAIRPSAITEPEVKGGGETVLVVEDVESLRALVRRALVRRGYVVLEAGDGRQALEICRTYEGPIHIVVSDVVMPGISGPESSEALKQMRRDMKVLFMSGYADETVQRYLKPDVPFLRKPFTPTELVRKVRETLDGR